MVKEAILKAIKGMGGNQAHLIERGLERLSRADEPFVQKAMERVYDLLRKRKRQNKWLPKDWKMKVTDDKGDVVGYLAGHKTGPHTIRTPDMKAYGDVIW